MFAPATTGQVPCVRVQIDFGTAHAPAEPPTGTYCSCQHTPLEKLQTENIAIQLRLAELKQNSNTDPRIKQVNTTICPTDYANETWQQTAFDLKKSQRVESIKKAAGEWRDYGESVCVCVCV